MAFERPHKSVRFCPGDCIEAMKGMGDDTLDSVVTDPPYHLQSVVKRFSSPDAAPLKDYEGGTGVYKRSSAGFMGKAWDGGDISFKPEFWAEVLRIMKPGAHLLSFGGTRTSHRMVCALEDAGFEIRDTVLWVYGQGFPKSHNISKFIDNALGEEQEVLGKRIYADGHVQNSHASIGFGGSDPQVDQRQITVPTTDEAKQWDGWGTALKPAIELICLARKPLSESTVAENVLAWGTGALNIDGCRIPGNVPHTTRSNSFGMINDDGWKESNTVFGPNSNGRWPANLAHDGSDEVIEMFPESDHARGNKTPTKGAHAWMAGPGVEITDKVDPGDSGSAARFFYHGA